MMHDEPIATPSSRYVFVYGTLRAGGSNDIRRFRPAPRYVASAPIAGTLYHLGGYPGVVLGGEGRVQGEIWQVDPAVEAQLDVLEDVRPDGTGEYRRTSVAVEVDQSTFDCLVYEINPDRLRGKPVIASGDWMRAR
jgi:gamma-glutamylcyclotransferase (GGCT)/AIG2-like uncharacterized protein YtfP